MNTINSYFNYFFILFFLLLVNCKDNSKSGYLSKNNWKKNTTVFLANCGACHSVGSSPKNGPTVENLTSFYKSHYLDFSTFQKKILNFVSSPDRQKVIMHKQADIFAIMPKMVFSESALAKIIPWLWNYSKFEKHKKAETNLEKFEGFSLNKQSKLFLANCGACHSFNLPEKNGPTVQEIVKQYKNKFKNQSSVKSAILDYIQSPKIENAIMKVVLKNYGLMPKMQFKEKELEEIADWMSQLNKRKSKSK